MANSGIVRISGRTRQTLEELARKSGEPMLSVMEKAIEEYRRRVFLEETNRAYAKLREDKKVSKEYNEEIAAWDATLMDGLDRSETWSEGKAQSAKGRAKKSHGKSRTW